MTTSTMHRLCYTALSVMGAFALSVGWYAKAADYDYSALAGTYAFTVRGDLWLLHLRSNQTFTERVSQSGRTQTVQGAWTLYGEGHVELSRTFIPIPGEVLGPSGEANGEFYKALGIWPSLSLGSDRRGLTLHKRLFG